MDEEREEIIIEMFNKEWLHFGFVSIKYIFYVCIKTNPDYFMQPPTFIPLILKEPTKKVYVNLTKYGKSISERNE